MKALLSGREPGAPAGRAEPGAATPRRRGGSCSRSTATSSRDELAVAATEENVLVQMNNLSTHPCVAARLSSGELHIYRLVLRHRQRPDLPVRPAAGTVRRARRPGPRRPAAADPRCRQLRLSRAPGSPRDSHQEDLPHDDSHSQARVTVWRQRQPRRQPLRTGLWQQLKLFSQSDRRPLRGPATGQVVPDRAPRLQRRPDRGDDGDSAGDGLCHGLGPEARAGHRRRRHRRAGRGAVRRLEVPGLRPDGRVHPRDRRADDRLHAAIRLRHGARHAGAGVDHRRRRS